MGERREEIVERRGERGERRQAKVRFPISDRVVVGNYMCNMRLLNRAARIARKVWCTHEAMLCGVFPLPIRYDTHRAGITSWLAVRVARAHHLEAIYPVHSSPLCDTASLAWHGQAGMGRLN